MIVIYIKNNIIVSEVKLEDGGKSILPACTVGGMAKMYK